MAAATVSKATLHLQCAATRMSLSTRVLGLWQPHGQGAQAALHVDATRRHVRCLKIVVIVIVVIVVIIVIVRPASALAGSAAAAFAVPTGADAVTRAAAAATAQRRHVAAACAGMHLLLIYHALQA